MWIDAGLLADDPCLIVTLVQPVLQAPAQQCFPTFIHSCIDSVLHEHSFYFIGRSHTSPEWSSGLCSTSNCIVEWTQSFFILALLFIPMFQVSVAKLVHACKLDNRKLETYWLNYSMTAKNGFTQYSM